MIEYWNVLLYRPSCGTRVPRIDPSHYLACHRR